ncbi:hypothetical protein ACLESD_16130 [Pyxidicoccus sp. 3LFB2]
MSKNIYPVLWKYDLPEQLLSALDEYHILKVPLLGQHYAGGPSNWCGRTSCTMAYNYYQVVQGGDFKSRFITHWDGSKPGQFVDLRYPGGQRAFHTKPLAPPFNVNLDGYSVSSRSPVELPVVTVEPPKFGEGGANAGFSASDVLGFAHRYVLPYSETDRQAQAARIANDPRLIESRLSLILKALIANNPVIFYSGFSAEEGAPIHLILIIGFAWLVDSSGRHLWLVVADPATQNNKIGNRKGGHLFFPPSPGSADGTDLQALADKKLSGDHDLIRVFRGEWDNADASLVLIRARKLFEENTYSTVKNDLFMDYFHPDNKGGAYLYSHRPTAVPPDFIHTNVMRSVNYPLDGHKSRFRPTNCYALTEGAAAGLFPLGMRRNLHSGIHLPASHFPVRLPPETRVPLPVPKSESQGSTKKGADAKPVEAPKTEAPLPAAPASTSRAGEREVRCFAPGYVVAVRLKGGLPEPIDETPEGHQRKNVPTEQGLDPSELAKEFTGNHNSFVLVRHDVEEVVKDKGETPKRFTFYSLYMHLVPPDWADRDTYRNVGWLKLLARRHGGLVVLDPKNEFFRQTRWLQEALPNAPEDKDVIPSKDGTFSVIGSGLGAPEKVVLGSPEGDLIRAVWKKPDQDLTGIHTALGKGQMVTLSHPYLKLEAGDLVGYVDGASKAVGEGFIHWEILAPSEPGQLKAFLDFAQEKLQLGDFFKVFEEKDQNNFFDPPKGELEELLKLAPRSKHASGGPEAEALERFQGTYHHGALKEILQSSRALPFSADDEPEAQEEPTYPAEILISNYKNALPPGVYRLKLTFDPPELPARYVAYDGKQTRLTLRLPARARKLFVEPEDANGLLLQSGGAGADALQKDVEHFKRLSSVRWRNVVLKHLNEWMPDSIVAQVMKHLEVHRKLRVGKSEADIQKPDEAKALFGEYAKAVGFWAHPDETPVLKAKAEAAKKLFADAPDADQLPAKGLLDNPHPVTFSWLLMLMVRHGLIRFTETPSWRVDEAKDLLAAGWLPARGEHPRVRVGEPVYVGAVARGSADEPVALHAKHEKTRLPLTHGVCTDGAFIEQVELPGWGPWTLDVPGAEALGALTQEGLPPALLGGRVSPEAPLAQVASESRYAPERRKDGTFTWRIAFRENCPKLLRGWVVLRAWVKTSKPDPQLRPEEPTFQVAPVAIPIVARGDTAFIETAGFPVIDGFVQKGSVKDLATYVTRHFTYKAFLDAVPPPPPPPTATRGAPPAPAAAPTAKVPPAPAAEPKLAWELVEVVQRIQSAYSEKQKLTLASLSEDGLSIELKAQDPVRLRELAAKTRDDGWLESTEDVGKTSVRIRVRAPDTSQHPGELLLDFDPTEAFSALRKGVPDTHELHVCFGGFFPNGGGALDSRLLPSDTLGLRCDSVKLEELRSLAERGSLEVWSTAVSAVLHVPTIEAPRVLVTAKGIQISARLLGGTPAFWEKARPVIKVGHEELDGDPKKVSSIRDGCVVRAFNFKGSNVENRLLTPTVEVLNLRVPLGAERIDVQPVKGPSYAMRREAKLETQSYLSDPFLLRVSLSTRAVPLDRPFKLEVTRPVSPGAPAPAALKLKKGTLGYKPDRKGVGVTDVDGIFHAEVDLKDVESALEGGREYVLRVVPVKKDDADLAREVTLTLPEPVDLGATGQPRIHANYWWWSEDVGSIPMKGEGI